MVYVAKFSVIISVIQVPRQGKNMTDLLLVPFTNSVGPVPINRSLVAQWVADKILSFPTTSTIFFAIAKYLLSIPVPTLSLYFITAINV